MSHASPAFAFSEAEEPLALAAARALAARLGADEPISRPALNAVMADCFGGSDAEGRWSVRDANAALELAQVLFVAEAAELTCAMSPDLADRVFTRLEALVPTQTRPVTALFSPHSSPLCPSTRSQAVRFCMARRSAISCIGWNGIGPRSARLTIRLSDGSRSIGAGATGIRRSKRTTRLTKQQG